MEQSPDNFNMTSSNSPNQHRVSALEKLWKNTEGELILLGKKESQHEK